MIKFKKQILEIANVNAGKTATIFLPIGPRYHKVVMVTGDSGAGNGNAPTNSAIIDEIKILAGGKEIRRCTAAELDVLNTFNGAGYASQASVSGGGNGTGRRDIPIFFAEPWRKRLIDQDNLALKTKWLGSRGTLQIQCALKTGITPVLTAYAITDLLEGDEPNGIFKWEPTDINASATPIQITNFERKGNWGQVSFFDTSDAKTVDRVRMVADGIELHDLTKQENTTDLKGSDMNPAAGAYHVVFDKDDVLDDLFPAGRAGSMSATLTMSAAPTGTLRYIVQKLERPTD